MEKNINIRQALFFSFLKNQDYKTKKSLTLIFKNEAINILGFKSIWISL